MIFTKKNIRLLWIGLIILGFCIVLLFNKLDTKGDGERYIYFYTANIYGEIKDVGIANHGSYFEIKEIDKGFVFYPMTAESNDFNIFYHLAEPKDTIIKKAFSDELILKKNGKEYIYSFTKIDTLGSVVK